MHQGTIFVAECCRWWPSSSSCRYTSAEGHDTHATGFFDGLMARGVSNGVIDDIAALGYTGGGKMTCFEMNVGVLGCIDGLGSFLSEGWAGAAELGNLIVI